MLRQAQYGNLVISKNAELVSGSIPRSKRVDKIIFHFQLSIINCHLPIVLLRLERTTENR